MAENNLPAYRPHPVDTSHVTLPPEQSQAVELLARNIHDLWAQQRMRDGWVPGPNRDDAQRTHPSLVPFAQLDHSEQAYDRIIAAETLKMLTHLGFQISSPPWPALDATGTPDQTTRPAQPAAPIAQDTPPASTLAQWAAGLQTRVDTAFRGVDDRAVRLHRRYRFVALVAAATGTLAVLLAILQLFISEQQDTVRNWLFAVEAAAASVSLIAVLYGIHASIHHHWILSRHQAERLRALHAEALISLLSVPLTDQELAAKIENVTHLSFAGLKSWLQRDLVPVPPEARQPRPNQPELLAWFRTQYSTLRLQNQARYLKIASARYGRLNHATRQLLPFLFFASIVCVGLHSVFHLLQGEFPPRAAHLFLMLAACLPALATGLRTYREAVQVSRNAARFSSKALAIEILRQDLAAAASLDQALQIAWHSEQVLESEHREWLRLMLEAEWFA